MDNDFVFNISQRILTLLNPEENKLLSTFKVCNNLFSSVITVHVTDYTGRFSLFKCFSCKIFICFFS